MSPDTEHLAPENPGARCRHLAPGTSPKPGKWGIPEKSLQKKVFVNRSTAQCSLYNVHTSPQLQLLLFPAGRITEQGQQEKMAGFEERSLYMGISFCM